jgi:hypothetical protein
MAGRDLAGTNITIPNGSMDPWHALAILNATFDPFSSPTEHLTPSERAVFIQDTAHCRRPHPFSALPRGSPPTHALLHSRTRMHRVNAPSFIRPPFCRQPAQSPTRLVAHEPSPPARSRCSSVATHHPRFGLRDMFAPNAFGPIGMADPEAVTAAHEAIRSDVRKYLGM